MKYINLTKGKKAMVDDDDFDYLNQWKWYFNSGYAVRGCPTRILMHRVILNTPSDLLTDHINLNRLDNRKCNLRFATKSLNNFNTKIRTDNKSGIKGIYWNKINKNWRTVINKECKRFNIGSFKKLEEAIIARTKAEKLYYGI